MLRLPETTDRGVDTACRCNFWCVCLWFLSIAHVWSGIEMIARASALGMGVGRCSRPLRGVGVLTMLDAGLDTQGQVESVCEVLLGAGVLVPSAAVGVFIDRHCVLDWVEVMGWVISATRELFSEGEGVQFWPWIVEATKLPPWEECLSPAGGKTRLLEGGKLRIPRRPMLWLFLNIWYHRSRVRMRA